MSALDELLSPENFPPCDPLRGEAQAELSQLKQRAADLELMLRAAGDRETYGWAVSRNLPDDWIFTKSRRCSDPDCEASHFDRSFTLKSGPGGLPILTEEARIALAREGGSP